MRLGSFTISCPFAWPTLVDQGQWRYDIGPFSALLHRSCQEDHNVSHCLVRLSHMPQSITCPDKTVWCWGQVKMNGYVMNPSWFYCTCCMPPLPVNGAFVRMCKRGALQFVFLKPVLAVITVVLYTQHKYTEGYWGANNGQVSGIALSYCQDLLLIANRTH